MLRHAVLATLTCVALGCNRKDSSRPKVQIAGSPSIESTCHVADSESEHFLRVIRATVAHEGLRATFHLSEVKPEEVRLIPDPVVCAAAGRAFDSLARVWVPKKPPASEAHYGPLYVFQVGRSYAVVDPNSPNESDCDLIFVFDSGWKYSGTACSQ